MGKRYICLSQMVVLLFATVFFLLSSLSAQTIVNTHDLISEIDSAWATNMEIQGSVSSGNGVFTAINSGLGLGYKLNTKSQIWLLSGYNYASESGNLIYQTGFINARHHRKITNSLNVQLFFQRQFNSALKMTSRQLLGVNLGLKKSIKDYLTSISLGLFDEDEKYFGQSFQHLQRMNISLNVTRNVGDVEINLTMYHQPSLYRFKDFRTLGELAIELPINESVNLEIESALRFDNDPHLDLLPLDFSTLIGMSFNL